MTSGPYRTACTLAVCASQSRLPVYFLRPRKTRFRLVASLDRAAGDTARPPQGPIERFQLSSWLLSLPGFSWRTGHGPSAGQGPKDAVVGQVAAQAGEHWRWACPTFLRQTFVEWTGETIPRSFWAKAYYDRKKASGASHNAAIRALAFKWIRILFRCWVDRVPYDESQYLSALQKRGSPVLKFAAEATA